MPQGNVPVWRTMTPSPAPSAQRQPAPVVIIGAGPVGLALALDLARRGQPVKVLNRRQFVAGGSKAICFAKRSLDIFDWLGIGQAVIDKGVTWNIGKVFYGDRADSIYQFDVLPVRDQRRPGFINIQQYYVESYLIEALAFYPNAEIFWGHDLRDVRQHAEGVVIEVESADGPYRLDAHWLVACDGSSSAVRACMGLQFEGKIFEDNFLIADIRMKGDFPAERWFWFDPPFNPGRSALLHKQPDDIWRLDFQLGWEIDKQACVRPENVEPYVRGLLGPDVTFEPVWYSVYTFQCRRMARFVHDRIIFAGDSAHLVSPFGARGCNGGLADIANLGWKLDLVLQGKAPRTLLESYDQEAIETADENIRNSTRSTDFMTPKTETSLAFRDAVLDLAGRYSFARPFVNSGRLSTAVAYTDSSLSSPDCDQWAGGLCPGAPAIDAPFGNGWLLGQFEDGFTLLCNSWAWGSIEGIRIIDIAGSENWEIIKTRYDLTPGAAYLIRPDHYVAARWKASNKDGVETALARAIGFLQPEVLA